MPAASSPASAPTGGRTWLVLVVLAAAGLDGLACGIRHAVHPAPLPAEAGAAFDRARAELERPVASPADEQARRQAVRAAAREAALLAPDWVAPRRLLDDLAREDLLASEALADHLRALEAHPDDALLLYLAGRLEGPRGEARFRRARSRDGNLAWAHHGLGWLRFVAGDARVALAHGEAAVRRARDPWERLYFTTALVRYLLELDRPQRAVDLLLPLVAPEGGLNPADRRRAALWLARAEMRSEKSELARRGFHRGLALLSSGGLPEEELAAFVDELRSAGARLSGDGATAVAAALAAHASPLRDALRARLAFRRGAPELARALVPRDGRIPARPAELRSAAFAAGVVAPTVEEWLGALPRVALAADGLPREASLRALVEASRRDDPAAFGRALLAAGWFEEALGFARHLAGLDAPAALDLEARALAARTFLNGVADVLGRLDWGAGPGGGWLPASRDPFFDPSSDAEAGGRGDLAGLLDAVEALASADLGATDLARNSPRLVFGPFAEVVHPGPRFSVTDELAGRGTAGEPVPGLAALFARLGRFALFGQALGEAPDGTVLRRLAIEHRAGSHLGVGFTGTVAWCEGSDVPSRPGRHGATIAGAALHEGYWVDVEGPRAEARRWARLARRFPPDAPRTRAVLAAAGPPLALAGLGPTAIYAADGLGDRLRVTVLAERAAARPELAPDELVGFEELLELTALHEEGHLCDRTRFLPLGRRFGKALGLLVRAGFSSGGIARRLEYRAQLTALAVADDPRLILAECLDALSGGSGATVHAAAYRRLVADLLERLEELRPRFDVLDDEHLLLHQLQRLGPEDVRLLARAQAARLGLIEE